jgi:hypothetical protein
VIAFTHDLETTELTPGEMREFGLIVREACVVYRQHRVSVLLEKRSAYWANRTLREARRMWRAAMLSSSPGGPEGDSLGGRKISQGGGVHVQGHCKLGGDPPSAVGTRAAVTQDGSGPQ